MEPTVQIETSFRCEKSDTEVKIYLPNDMQARILTLRNVEIHASESPEITVRILDRDGEVSVRNGLFRSNCNIYYLSIWKYIISKMIVYVNYTLCSYCSLEEKQRFMNLMPPTAVINTTRIFTIIDYLPKIISVFLACFVIFTVPFLLFQ